MPKTIQDLRDLGYELGIAHGSVAAEEAALEEAKRGHDPAVLGEQTRTVVADTVATLDRTGQLPPDQDARLELATQIAEQALALLTAAADDRISFHERALKIAQEMPDVWRVSQVCPDGTVIVSTMVATDHTGVGIDADHQAHLDELADADAYAERFRRQESPPEQHGPTIPERLAVVLANAPEIGEKTRAALLAALDEDPSA